MGPASGNGAAYDFSGSKSGSGHIEILEAVPPSKVLMRVHMTKPMQVAPAKVSHAGEITCDEALFETLRGLRKSLGALFSGDQSLLDQEVKGGVPLGGGGGECATEGGGGNEELLGAVVHG